MSCILFTLLTACSAAFTPVYQRSQILPNGFDAKSSYFPCAPVEAVDDEHDITYTGRRCPDHVDLEVFSNIRYAADSPLIPPPPPTILKNQSSSSGATSSSPSSSFPIYSYPSGSTVDTAFPFASCPQLHGLPYNLTYEHISAIEEASQTPISEDCLTLSIFRPADLPDGDDLSALISPTARNSTHTRGLLPVTLIIDESGPRDEEAEANDDDDDDDGYERRSRASSMSQRERIEANAAYIVQRDMADRGTGRVIVVANFGVLDMGRRQRIFETLKATLADMVRSGESATGGTCRTPAEFRRLQALARARDARGAHPIEWPLHASARGRGHADILLAWIRRNIAVWRGDPSWVQEVVILPEGAMTRTTTEPEWQARRLVKQEDLDREIAEAKASEEGSSDQKMILNIPI